MKHTRIRNLFLLLRYATKVRIGISFTIYNDSKNDKNTANKLQCGLREVFYLFCALSCLDILYLLRDNDLLAGLILFLKIFGCHAELFQE